MIIKDYVQGSSEWLEMRKNFIMASDAPVIMGESPWSTPFQLWEKKLDLAPPTESNFYMKRGLELEPIALEAYNNYTGNQAVPCVVFSEDISYMGASLDGLSADQKTIVEIKCPGQKDHDLAASGVVPEKYKGQLQHQLYTSSLNLLHYFSFRDNSFHLIEVFRDKDYIKKMLLKEKEFFDCLRNFNPPKDHEVCIERKDDKWIQLSLEWKETYQQIKRLQEKEKELKQLLIQESNDRNSQGSGVKVTKVSKKGVIDYSAIPQIKDVDIEKYRKKSSVYWKISTTK